MYFWRIFKLRETLVNEPLADRLAIRYLLAFIILAWVIIALQAWFAWYPTAQWYPGYLALLGFIEVCGIYGCYHANGGANGTAFLSKFIALAWVMFCRLLVFGLIILVLGLFVIEFFTGQRTLVVPHFWWIALFSVGWLIVYYWRMIVHLKYIK